MRKKAFIFLSWVFLFIGCTANESPQEADQPVQVQFAVPTIGVDVSTRSSSSLSTGTAVRVLAFSRVGSNADLSKDRFAGEGTYTVADNSGTLTPVSHLLLLAGTYDFYLLTPDLAVSHQVPYTVSVNHDMDYADGSVGGVTVTQDAPTVTFPPLTRRCSMVTFELSPLASNIASAEVTEAGLSHMTDAPVTTSLTSGLNVNSIACETTVRLTGFKAESAQKPLELSSSAVVLPRRAGAFNFNLSVKFNGGIQATDLSAPLPDNIAFSPGTRYVFTVKLKGDGAELTLTIAPWGSNDDTSDMGGANVIVLKVGEWTDVHWDNGQSDTGGGNTSLVIGGWQPNQSWNDDLGKYALLGIVCDLWKDISWINKPDTGGGNTNLTPDDWNNGLHVTDDANGGNMGEH